MSPSRSLAGRLRIPGREPASRRALSRPTKAPFGVPARRAKSPARRRSEIERRRAGSSENGEVDQADDSQAEQERVRLQVADLKQPEERTDSPRSRARAANGRAIENPAVDKRAQFREQFLRRFDEERIEFVEIKAFPEQREIDRIVLAISIKNDREKRAGACRAERHAGNQPAGFVFSRH